MYIHAPFSSARLLANQEQLDESYFLLFIHGRLHWKLYQDIIVCLQCYLDAMSKSKSTGGGSNNKGIRKNTNSIMYHIHSLRAKYAAYLLGYATFSERTLKLLHLKHLSKIQENTISYSIIKDKMEFENDLLALEKSAHQSRPLYGTTSLIGYPLRSSSDHAVKQVSNAESEVPSQCSGGVALTPMEVLSQVSERTISTVGSRVPIVSINGNDVTLLMPHVTDTSTEIEVGSEKAAVTHSHTYSMSIPESSEVHTLPETQKNPIEEPVNDDVSNNSSSNIISGINNTNLLPLPTSSETPTSKALLTEKDTQDGVTASYEDRLWAILADALLGLRKVRKKDPFFPHPVYRFAHIMTTLADCEVYENTSRSDPSPVPAAPPAPTDVAYLPAIYSCDANTDACSTTDQIILPYRPHTPAWFLKYIQSDNPSIVSKNTEKSSSDNTDSLLSGLSLDPTVLESNLSSTVPPSKGLRTTMLVLACNEMYKLYEKRRSHIVALWMSETATSKIDQVSK